MKHSLSIVIPVRNEAKHMRACIESWLSQTVEVEKIVVIDSGSTDGTLEILAEYPKVQLIVIDGSTFNHGTTRNIAMQQVTTDLTLMTVGDGRAASDDVLQRMMAAFTSDDVAGVCGHQIVAHEPDKNPVEWFRPQSEPVVRSHRFESADAFDNASPEEKHTAGSWDDVIAMYRTDILKNVIPYKAITYGEDTQWAVDALRAGYTLTYDPGARIYHYHLENEEVSYKRAVTMLYLRDRFFGSSPDAVPPGFGPLLRSAKTLFATRGLKLSEKLHWLRHNMGQNRAVRKAVSDFLAAKKQGQQSVTDLHDRCAGKPFKVAAS